MIGDRSSQRRTCHACVINTVAIINNNARKHLPAGLNYLYKRKDVVTTCCCYVILQMTC